MRAIDASSPAERAKFAAEFAMKGLEDLINAAKPPE